MNPRTTPKDWPSLRRRARAVRSTIARTHPDDGRERYVLVCGEWYEVFHHIEHLVAYIEQEEERQREIESQPAHRRWTPEEHERARQEAYLGALSSAIASLDRQLDGRRSISRVTLTMAQSEGRDYLAELRERRADRVVERWRLSCELAATGKAPRRHAEYQRAAREIAPAEEK